MKTHWILLLLITVFSVAALWLIYDLPGSRFARTKSARHSDLVRIYRLQGLDSQYSGTLFSVIPGEDHPVYGQIDLRGKDLDAFRGLWRAVYLSKGPMVMCHTPQYGIEFLKGDRVKLRTAVSWECSNLTLSSLLYRWDSLHTFEVDSPSPLELLNFLDVRLPYDRDFRIRREKEMQEFRDSLENKE